MNPPSSSSIPASLADHIATDEITRTVYSTDNSIYQITPAGVALPKTTSELVEVVKANAESESPGPIVARGGGTGTNGQSLTTGVMIDLKRNLNRIVDIDAKNMTAVVEPGVVTAALNVELKKHGLFWAPHTSTLSRATVGGMIATDAAGKGSLVYGRAHRHVQALDIVLADGTEFRAEPIPIAEAEARADAGGRVGEVWRALLDLEISEGDTFDLPELARGFSGYGIDRLRRNGMIDPLALLVGSEGTLGITTRATIGLSPIAEHTTLVVAAYSSFDDALQDALLMRETGPTAIESFDERTLDAGRNSPAWPALGQVVGDMQGSVLLLEYDGADPVDPAPIHAALEANGRAVRAQTLPTATERSQAWKVRADAVGLLAKVEIGAPDLSARPTAMVEDCAVPVANMPAFIADFRAALDSFGVTYGMFGHADVGCVHVRPALDITDPGHEKLVRDITDKVVDVVKKHKGVLWGEHGRGIRGDVAPEFLTPDTIGLMRQIKAIFDPNDLLNPGKLYRPAGSELDIIGLDEAPMRGQINRAVPVEIRREFSDAFACNGNGLCHQHSATDAMCPSYKASGDPALSPKGRADLMRSMLLRRQTGGDEAFEDAVAENLNQCLSCAACSGTCPVEVNIPELKSQFFEAYYETRKRPLAHLLLSKFESLAALAAVAPKLAGLGAKPAGKALGLIDLPAPKKRSGPTAFNTFDASSSTNVNVVLLRDVFTDKLEPDTIEHAAVLLTRVGLQVELSPFVPSGKFDHVKGKRMAFAKSVAAQRALVESIVAAGATPVAIEPAVALLHEHEYPTFDPSYPTTVRHLVDVLHEHRGDIAGEVGSKGAVSLLGHCTERATRPESLSKWEDVLTAAGYLVDTPALGCCGMAGIFGHEVANQAMSEQLWHMGWDAAAQASTGRAVATGYSCRSQAARLSGTTLQHPVTLL